MYPRLLLSLTTVLMVSFSALLPGAEPNVLPPAERKSAPTLHLIGSLASYESISVVSQVDGVVGKYVYDVGEVTVGSQPLVKINQDDYLLAQERARASLAQANADLTVKKSRYERYQQLEAQNNLAREQLDSAQADYLVSKADVRLKEIALDEAELALGRTSINGDEGLWVSERLIHKGDWVHAGQKLYQLEHIEKLKAVVYITEDYVSHLSAGQGVRLTAEAIPDRHFTGHIKAIAIRPDPTRNSYPVEIVMDNPGLVLRPGFTVDAEISVPPLADRRLAGEQ